MHFGMTGWIKFSNDDSAYYKPQNDKGISDTEWPPKYWKFVLELAGEPKCEVAFVDPRRLARIRLVDAEANKIRKTDPLSKNGPDPVIDKDTITVEWLQNKLGQRKVPVKALLLDQSCISGIGNWVADEVLYQAKLHPEQYSNTFSEEQIKNLHHAIIDVCTIAVETLAESAKFPEDWLMKHRWGKGKEGGDKLPNGERIIHLKVGGRTSAVVPSVQKKTGAVAADVDDETGEQKPNKRKAPRQSKKTKAKKNEENGTAKKKEAKKGVICTRKEAEELVKASKGAVVHFGQDDDEEEDNSEYDEEPTPKRTTRKRRERRIEEDGDEDSGEEAPTPKQAKRGKRATKRKQVEEDEDEEESSEEEEPAPKRTKRTKKSAA